METYWVLKFLHLVGASVLFGTGAGIAFFMFAAWYTGDVAVIAKTARLVVKADYIFTAPAVVLQLVTGFLLIHEMDYPLPETGWVTASLALYVLVGCCWLPVVRLQIGLRDMAEDALRRSAPLPDAFHRRMRLWTALGVPAFAGVLAIFALMIVRPEL